MNTEILFIHAAQLYDSVEFEHFHDTPFECDSELVRARLGRMPGVILYGICIINGVSIKFQFCPNNMDGKICTYREKHRMLMKNIIPHFVYARRHLIEKHIV